MDFLATMPPTCRHGSGLRERSQNAEPLRAGTPTTQERHGDGARVGSCIATSDQQANHRLGRGGPLADLCSTLPVPARRASRASTKQCARRCVASPVGDASCFGGGGDGGGSVICPSIEKNCDL